MFALGLEIARTVRRWTDIPVAVGIAPTKTRAKRTGEKLPALVRAATRGVDRLCRYGEPASTAYRTDSDTPSGR
ncbi:hypothetical protein [Thiocapsa rosea]|uniref:hypothetical protein n=1 Tax=Thiocapsa rosea TaxID=69360 RepID=UPI000EAE7C73|nr:hypothetical protein [Thiocapsa rosea]